MNLQPSREFGASAAGLAEALAFVEAFCAAAAVTGDDALRLTLVVEELFTNTVEHGHQGGAVGARVRLQLIAEPTRLTLHYEDEAPPFDPRPRVGETAPLLDAPAEERPAGGLGIHLVAGFASELEYERRDDRNRLRLVLPRRSAGTAT